MWAGGEIEKLWSGGDIKNISTNDYMVINEDR
jgi:hypothetical protein